LLNPFPREALEFASAVERAGQMILAARRGLGKARGLSLADWRLLEVIGQSRSRLSFAITARRLQVSRQTVREAARVLQARGLVAIVADPLNRKELRLLATPTGELERAGLDDLMSDLLLEMTDDIPLEDLIAATRVLSGLARRMGRCETVIRRQQPRSS
jgi:DNA-binding MarR family transcriptional regulator